jgi:hypothetical protein
MERGGQAGAQLEITSVSRPDPDADKWEERARDLRLNELPNIQATAAQWSTVITALTGIFGVLLLARGPEDVLTLTRPWQIAVAVAVLLAFLLLVAGIYLATWAAEGTYTRVRPTGPAIRRLYQDEAPRAGRKLQGSQALVFLAVVLIAASVALTWYGQRQSASAPTVLVLERSGAVLCGVLTTDTVGRVSLMPPGRTSAVQVSDVVSVTPVPACT